MSIEASCTVRRSESSLSDGFEYAELAVPKAALEAAGAEIEVISLHEGRIRGMKLTEPTRTVKVDRVVDEASVDDYDGLLILGGFVGPDFVRKSEQARIFVRLYDAASKPIATLCHGPWVLISAGLANGRRLPSFACVGDSVDEALRSTAYGGRQKHAADG